MSEGSYLESSLRFRTAAIKNIENYCDQEGEDFDQVFEYVTEEAREKTFLKSPLEFYRELYNESLTFKNKEK